MILTSAPEQPSLWKVNTPAAGPLTRNHRKGECGNIRPGHEAAAEEGQDTNQQYKQGGVSGGNRHVIIRRLQVYTYVLRLRLATLHRKQAEAKVVFVPRG
jgi:hypothetical protein